MFSIVCSLWCGLCGVFSVVCSRWCGLCGVVSVVCSLWCCICGMFSVVCSLWYVVCSVLYVVCFLLCVLCSVFSVMCCLLCFSVLCLLQCRRAPNWLSGYGIPPFLILFLYKVLRNCVTGCGLGTATCLSTVAGGKQGHAVCRIPSLQQVLFLSLFNFMEIIRLSQSLGISGQCLFFVDITGCRTAVCGQCVPCSMQQLRLLLWILPDVELWCVDSVLRVPCSNYVLFLVDITGCRTAVCGQCVPCSMQQLRLFLWILPDVELWCVDSVFRVPCSNYVALLPCNVICSG